MNIHGPINNKKSVGEGGGQNLVFRKKGQLIKILAKKKAQNHGKNGVFSQIIVLM